MRTLVTAALGAALLFASGCSLSIDPNSVEAPKAPPKVTPRGACVTTTGHKLCGGQISAGAAKIGSTGHLIDGAVGTSAPDLSSTQHMIVRGDVSP